MKNLYAVLAILLVLGALFASQGTPEVVASDVPKILEFDSMAGVSRPYTGAANAIRGVPGGGLPWVIADAEGKLKADGTLEVEVEGLVFDPNDQGVIDRGFAGQNTVPAFKAIVSCLSRDAAGNAVTINVSTDSFPATIGLGAGDAKIEARLALPSPCIAPIIFVTNPAGAWFAATGN